MFRAVRTRVVVRNAVIGATISSLLAAVLLFVISHHLGWTDLPYLWCAATLSTVVYGLLAVRLGIYGQGSHALRSWKNALLGVLIVIAISVITSATDQLVGASAEITAPLTVAVGLAMVISDARA